MKKICIGILLLLAVILGITNCIKVNRKYPNPQMVLIKEGEESEYNGVGIQIKKAETIGWKELKQKYPVAAEVHETVDESQVVHVTLSLTGYEDSGVDLTEIAVQNEFASTQAMYSVLQETMGTSRINLTDGEKKEVELYFLFCKEWFYDTDWKNWDTMNFYLEILHTYPMRYCFELDI